MMMENASIGMGVELRDHRIESVSDSGSVDDCDSTNDNGNSRNNDGSWSNDDGNSSDHGGMIAVEVKECSQYFLRMLE